MADAEVTGGARLATRLLVLVALVLPFEAPLFRAGPLLITTVELVLYLALAAWGGGLCWEMVRRGSASAPLGRALGLGRGDGLALAAVAWLAVGLAAAALAPAHRAEAVKFALRAVGGGLLLFAARDLLRSEAAARRVATAIVASALLSAVAALAENTTLLPASVWLPFRPMGFSAVGLPRASGPFAYPTIAAMYWEAALPLIAVMPWRPSLGRAAAPGSVPRRDVVFAVAGAMLVVAAIFASATRTALVGAALAAAAMFLVGTRAALPPVRRVAAATLAVITLFLAATLLPGGSESLLGQRLRWWRDGTWYRVRYQVDPAPLTIPAGALVEIPVTIENTGSLGWPRSGTEPVRLSYHWETSDAGVPRLLFEGRRTPLPFDIPPGGAAALSAVVEAPYTPGPYRLRWDLVREQVTWFSERGNPTADQQVEVAPDPRARMVGARRRGPRAIRGTLEDLVSFVRPSRLELWRAAVRLWWQYPVLGAGPDNFRRMYPAVMPPPRTGRRYEDDRLHANNLYLETLAGTGILGLAALAALAVVFARRVRAQIREPSPHRLLATACAVAVGTFFVHGALDYFFEFSATYGLFWLLLALAVPLRPPAAGAAG